MEDLNIFCDFLDIDNMGKIKNESFCLETFNLENDINNLIKEDFTLIYGDNCCGKTFFYNQLKKKLKNKDKIYFFSEDFNEEVDFIQDKELKKKFDLYVELLYKNTSNLISQRIKKFCFDFFKIIELSKKNNSACYYLFQDDLFDNFDKKNILILIRMIKKELIDLNIKIKIIGFTHNINLGHEIFMDNYLNSKQKSVDFIKLSTNFFNNFSLNVLESKTIVKEKAIIKQSKIIYNFIGGVSIDCKVGLPLKINGKEISDSKEFIIFLEDSNQKFFKKNILEWSLLLGISDINKFINKYGIE